MASKPASDRAKSVASQRVLSREQCFIVVKEHAGHSDFVLEGWNEIRLGGDQPLGLLGSHLWAEMDVQWLGEAPRREKLTFFVKALPSNEAHSSFVESIGAATKEYLYYAELEPAMRATLSAQRHDSHRKGSSVVPVVWGCRCLLARRSILVLEDLAAQGFRNGGARDEPSYAQTALVARALASLHAHSLAFERTRDAQLGRCFRLNDFFPEIFRETFYARGEHQHRFTSSGVAALTACALLLPRCSSDAAVAQTVKELLPTVLWRINDWVQPSEKHRNALAHGDLWLNNILFRNDPATGQPVDVRLVDFQLARYQPPAFELLQFLHVCCRRSFRERYEQELLHEYYKHLQEQLSVLGCQPEQLLPWTAFQASWPEARLYGRLMAPFFQHFILTDEKVLGEVFGDEDSYRHVLYDGRAEHAVTQFRTDPVYRERLSESLEELIEEHVLSKDNK